MTAAERIARWFSESESAVAFTGAGISTESGIPDFRSPGGVWSRNRTVYYQEFLDDPDARLEYWRQKTEAHDAMADAEPNIVHRLLAEWEAAGRLRGVITQNIDNLHRRAGSRNVLELHGNAMRVTCLKCDTGYETDPLTRQFRATGEVPICENCGRDLLKHATISFGQTLDVGTLTGAVELSQNADLFLALGSSLVVHPAASLPELAKERGARLVIATRTSTPLDSIADLVVHEPLGELFTAVAAAL